MSLWADLPKEIWTKVFQFLPLTDRLGSCSLVNRQWHKCAAAATQVLELECPQRPHLQAAFSSWMQHHGSHLERLKLKGYEKSITSLPCPQLRDLELEHCTIQLDSSDDDSGFFHSCKGHDKLDLRM